ncbi:MAG: helix-hairpin-helix domain-containing protein [Deltaproteobacteria bacterium]|nr:helix-hairpin-helix domain-containing protein [Deltaproteobacteria bacterium]
MIRLLRCPSLVALVFIVLGADTAAQAVQYDLELDIDSEADLYDLAARGELEESEVEALVELLREGVDLNSASREEIYELPGLTYEDVDTILRYREQTRIDDPADLVVASAITQEQLLQIAPFLLLRGRDDLPVSGHALLVGAFSAQDKDPPPAYLVATGKLPYNLSAGIGLATTRRAMFGVRYSLDQNGLVADQPSYRFQVPKFFAMWKTPMFQVVAGTFRLGFGQRLTLDNSTRQRPNGVYADTVIYTLSEELRSACNVSNAVSIDGEACEKGLYTTPDFRWREGFRGLAVSARKIPLAGAEMSLTAFGSYQNKSLYQYELWSPDLCTDPHDDDNENCKAPWIHVAGASTFEERFKYMTLRDLFNEVAAGGNVQVDFGHVGHLGISGYWANDLFNVQGMALDFQEWSNRPYGGPFGAVGIDGSARAGRVNLALEATRTFDSLPSPSQTDLDLPRMPDGGGGFGVLGRAIANVQKTHEIDFSARFYDRNFVNPLSRPMANSDEFEGQRARNEAGVRFKYRGKPNEDWIVRTAADLSIWPEDGEAPNTAGVTNLELLGALDFVGWRSAKLTAEIRYKNKDVAVGGRGQCFAYQVVETSGEPAPPCAGEGVRFKLRGHYEPLGKLLAFTAGYAHNIVDDHNYEDSFRQDSTAWFDVTSFPHDQLRLRLRTRYKNEALDKATYLEDSLWTYLDVGYLPNKIWDVHVRYDTYAWLDDRKSTS